MQKSQEWKDCESGEVWFSVGRMSSFCPFLSFYFSAWNSNTAARAIFKEMVQAYRRTDERLLVSAYSSSSH